ncbi:MAG: hypothetical protein J3R72DRAFT_195679 [Linnemannia gamsii]|nr:MAG: hypothetical protein J3R72DRAFT_195679 [Linnemannia gamsii]
MERQLPAFSVDIDQTKTVDHLKKFIKTEIPDTFNGVYAKDLILWRVSILITRDNSEIPILFNNIAKEEKGKLHPADDLSDIFDEKPPKKTIHIIVQRPSQVRPPAPSRALTPLPGYLSDGSRPATPIQLKSVPKDHIEKELAVVLEGISHHHITEPVDPKDVESSQRERLGPFYKRTLPYHETATDTSLVMLGLELDKQASTIDGETLHSIRGFQTKAFCFAFSNTLFNNA